MDGKTLQLPPRFVNYRPSVLCVCVCVYWNRTKMASQHLLAKAGVSGVQVILGYLTSVRSVWAK